MPDDGLDSFPIPLIKDEDKEFWGAVQQKKLLAQKCMDCKTLQYFPRPVCVRCFGNNLGWEKCSGFGIVYSFCRVNMPVHPSVKNDVKNTGKYPIFAKIELDEGIRILSEIVGSKIEQINIGARVKVSFEKAKGQDFLLPLFRLIGEEDSV